MNRFGCPIRVRRTKAASKYSIVPVCVWLSSRRNRTGWHRAIRSSKYSTSFSVVSGAFFLEPAPLDAISRLVGSRTASRTAGRDACKRLPIIAASRLYAQTLLGRGQLHGVKALLRQRRALGVVSDQVLRAQGEQNVVQRPVERGTDGGLKHLAASAAGELGQRIL